jgi:hypothetical protein
MGISYMTPSEKLDQLIDETITNMQEARNSIDIIDRQSIAKQSTRDSLDLIIQNLINVKNMMGMGLSADIDDVMGGIDDIYNKGW